MKKFRELANISEEHSSSDVASETARKLAEENKDKKPGDEMTYGGKVKKGWKFVQSTGSSIIFISEYGIESIDFKDNNKSTIYVDMKNLKKAL